MQAGTGKNRVTPLCDPDSMVFIGVKGSMITAKNNVKILTRNSTDLRLLENGCRESLSCHDSDYEGAFESADAVPVDRSRELWQGQEQPGENSGTVEEELTGNRRAKIRP